MTISGAASVRTNGPLSTSVTSNWSAPSGTSKSFGRSGSALSISSISTTARSPGNDDGSCSGARSDPSIPRAAADERSNAHHSGPGVTYANGLATCRALASLSRRTAS